MLHPSQSLQHFFLRILLLNTVGNFFYALHFFTYFYCAMLCYASVVYAFIMCPSVHLSVRLSVTSRSSTKMAEPRITQTKPYDSPETLVC